MLYLSAEAGSATQAAYLDGIARSDLDQAIELDPQYPDAHFFRAIVLAYEYQDYAGAQDDLQHYLVLAPNGQFADQVRSLLAQVTDGASRNILVVAQSDDELTWKSLRNVPAVHLLAEDQLNTYDVLVSDYVVFTEAALRTFVERGEK